MSARQTKAQRRARAAEHEVDECRADIEEARTDRSWVAVARLRQQSMELQDLAWTLREAASDDGIPKGSRAQVAEVCDLMRALPESVRRQILDEWTSSPAA